MPQPSVRVVTHPQAEPLVHHNLTNIERRGVYQQLLDMTEGGELPCTAFRDVARRFGCHPRTAKRVWIRGQASIAAGSPAAIVASQIRGMSSDNRYFITCCEYRFSQVY
jgi:hypothetical protein